MKVFVSGLGGHMGRVVADLCQQGLRDAELFGGVDPQGADGLNVPCALNFSDAPLGADIILDFSNHACTRDLLDFAVKNNLPLVLATTGQTDEERAWIQETSKKIPLFFASNYSVGVALLVELAKKAAMVFPDADIEIVETHHNRKADAPSGTALTLAKEIQSVRENAEITMGRSGYGKRNPGEIGIQSIRLGNVVGEHEILIGTANETITLKHQAHSRALFAEGALAAAEYLLGKPVGLYDMKSMLSEA